MSISARYFSPSLISYAARDGAVPLEIHGALPAGLTAEEIAQVVRLPGRAEGLRLVTAQGPDRAVTNSENAAIALLDDRIKSMMGRDGRDFQHRSAVSSALSNPPGNGVQSSEQNSL